MQDGSPHIYSLRYIDITGDYAGRVSGAVYDITDSTNPVRIANSPAWTSCKLSLATRTASSTSTATRRLLAAYTQAQSLGGERGRKLMQETVAEVEAMLSSTQEGVRALQLAKEKSRQVAQAA